MIHLSNPPAGIARCLALGASVAALSGLLVAPAADASPTAGASAADTVTSTSARPFQVPANGRYILRLTPGTDAGELSAGLASAGARLVAAQPGLGLAVAQLAPSSLAAVTALPFVRSAAPDFELHPQSLGSDAKGQAGSLAAITAAIGANAMWKRGYTGAGVDVALLDTGVAPSPGLADPAKVAIGPDLSFESQQPEFRSRDTYGHGTNMAGIIAGREGAKASGVAYAADSQNFHGVAPDARIVSLKLADHNGAVDVSQMIAAIDWVAQNQKRNGLNLRVLNISYGTLSRNDAQSDPLAWAAESAWRAGVVVVASAGNEGAATGVTGMASPAYNPWVLAVGAADTRGTVGYADDVVPAFSQRGDGAAVRGPDLVAPGVGVVSLGVAGSKLATDHPRARIGTGLMRGSGTSQAAAVVSGAAALVLQQYPWMTPDDVKGHLTGTATKLGGVTPQVQGSGEINLGTALGAAAVKSRQSHVVGHGRGTLDRARGGAHVRMDGAKLAGEQDVMGSVWNSTAMATDAGARNSWKTGGVFNGATWIGGDGPSVDTSTWTGAETRSERWNGRRWTGGTWNGRRWTGDAWSGRTWSGRTWSGRTWSGRTWSGRTWSGRRWTGADWTGATWTGEGWSSADWKSPVEAPAWAGRVWAAELWG